MRIETGKEMRDIFDHTSRRKLDLNWIKTQIEKEKSSFEEKQSEKGERRKQKGGTSPHYSHWFPVIAHYATYDHFNGQ